MTITYADALSLSFGESPFTVEEFRIRIGSLRPSQSLSELKTRGIVRRVERGKYRLLAPGERPDLRAEEWSRVRIALLDSGLPMAWTGTDAVSLWTGGRYTLSPTMYLREFSIEVPSRSVPAWRRYLRARRISTNPHRRTGAIVHLSSGKRSHFASHRGEPVIPRGETLELIRSHRGLYGEADNLVERQR